MDKFVVVIVVLTSVAAISVALECGVGRNPDQNLRNALSECIKDNQTLEKIWDMASGSSTESESESSSSSEENKSVPVLKGTNTKGASSTNQSNSSLRHMMRLKRSPKSSSDRQVINQKEGNGNRQQQRPQQSTTTVSNADEESSSVASTVEGSTKEQENSSKSNSETESESNKCILQCVFEKLDMTDSNGFPDHKQFADGLLKTASGRELRDFLQESTDECFQQLENEGIEDSCIYSTKLITCLAEKGRSNCSDWPTGNLPF